MCSYSPLHIEKVALAVTVGVAGATAISGTTSIYRTSPRSGRQRLIQPQ